MACRVEEDIFGLEVTVYNVVLVQVLERKGEFGDVEPRAIFSEPGLSLQVPEELSARLEIGHEEEFLVGLEAKFETDQEGTFERRLEDLALADGVRDLFLGYDFLLREHLHGIDSLRVPFSHLEDTAEGALADKLEDLKVTRLERAFRFRLLIRNLDS